MRCCMGSVRGRHGRERRGSLTGGLPCLGSDWRRWRAAGRGCRWGAGQAVVPVAKELGPQMLKDGFEQGLRRAGITNLAALDVGRMQELLAKAEQVALPPLDFPGADQVRPQIEAIRVKLLAEAGAFLNARETNSIAGRSRLRCPLASLALNALSTSLCEDAPLQGETLTAPRRQRWRLSRTKDKLGRASTLPQVTGMPLGHIHVQRPTRGTAHTVTPPLTAFLRPLLSSS